MSSVIASNFMKVVNSFLTSTNMLQGTRTSSVCSVIAINFAKVVLELAKDILEDLLIWYIIILYCYYSHYQNDYHYNHYDISISAATNTTSTTIANNDNKNTDNNI